MHPYEKFVLQCQKLSDFYEGEQYIYQVKMAKLKMAEETAQHFRNLVMTPINHCNNCGTTYQIGQSDENYLYDVYPHYIYPMVKWGLTICARCYDAYYEEILCAITRKALFHFVPGLFTNKDGNFIKVKRTNGTIEDNWLLSNNVMNYFSKNVVVRNNFGWISKSVPIAELYELNPAVEINFNNYPIFFTAVDFAMIIRVIGKKDAINQKEKMLEEIIK